MKTKLPFLMLALLPFAAFGQTQKMSDTQATKYPSSTHSAKSKTSSVFPKSATMFKPAASPLSGKAVIFQENFDGAGPGFAGWTKIDVDGKTPAPAVNFITTGWNRIDKMGANGNYGGPSGDFAAMSTSWYSPAGMSNDWLITPSIAIPAGTATFQWEAKAQDPLYPDGYKLMLAPNGGNTVADFTVELFNIAEENGEWATRTVNLLPYAGTSVRLAFVNNSNDKFLLLVDNISVTGDAAPPATGCLTAPNGLWPAATYVPSCVGTVKDISTVCYAGEYSNVNVTAGTSYTFSLSNPAYFITIGDAAGTTVLGSGTGSLTWTSTVTGVVRFYSHIDNACTSGTSATIHTRSIKCGTPPPAANACTDFKVLANNFENGGFIGGTTAQKLAADLPIGATAFTIYGVEPTVIGAATTFSINMYADNAGLPGALLGTKVGTIASSTLTGNAFGYDFYKYSVVFDTPFAAAANTKYWMELLTDAVGWESSSVATLGTKDAFQNSGTAGAWVIGTDDYVFNLICSNPLAVSDVNKGNVSYYPNPVKDILTINSKKAIENVQVYNVAGQKMPVSSKVVNGKVDMSKMAPGVYIISTILEGGANESFKVIKK